MEGDLISHRENFDIVWLSNQMMHSTLITFCVGKVCLNIIVS